MSDDQKPKSFDVVDKEYKPKVELKLKKTAQIKPKFYYDVKEECTLPAVVTYRVLAEDPQQAAELVKGMSPIGVQYKIAGKRGIKLSVYEAGSSMLKWVKNLLGT